MSVVLILRATKIADRSIRKKYGWMTKRKLGKGWSKAFPYIFGAPQLSFGLIAGEFSYNPEPLGEIHTVSYHLSVHQAQGYKNNQQTDRSQKRAVMHGKQGLGFGSGCRSRCGFPHSAIRT
jgi:hypothetical protein